MNAGIWIAASGATAQSERLENISHNLANLNTPGFKKNELIFEEIYQQQQNPVDIPAGPIRDKDFYPLDNKEQSLVHLKETALDLSSGALELTANPLDFALQSEGFFEILTPQGIQYTRAGNFKLSSESKLVTSQGFTVLSQDGDSPAGERAIVIPDKSNQITVSQDGKIFADRQFIGQLSIVTFDKPELNLKKAGHSAFVCLNPLTKRLVDTPLVAQGMLEKSNVNPIQAMGEMILTHRLFENNLKAMKTMDEMMNKESNEIGRA